MSRTPPSVWAALADAKRAIGARGDTVGCGECAGTGLTDGDEAAPPCLYCDGSGRWEGVGE